MPTPSLSFAKIVATPTASAWSQAYNAGSLFAVISLTSLDEPETPLALDGKKILNALQAEVFGLEEKTFESITKAVKEVLTSTPVEATLSLALCFYKDTTLYTFLQGSGTISLKRGVKQGILLQNKENTQFLRASGYLQTGDIVLLQTEQFSERITPEKLSEALDLNLPSDIAETLTPTIHGGENGGASAIILSFKGAPIIQEEREDEEAVITQPTDETTAPLQEALPEESSIHIKLQERESPYNENLESPSNTPSFFSRIPDIASALMAKLPFRLSAISNRQKIVAGMAGVLILLLIVGVFLVKSNQATRSQQELFDEVYTKATEQYEEGEDLATLNAALAQADYADAKDTLSALNGKLKADSKQDRQYKELLTKIESRLDNTSTSSVVTTQEVELSAFPLLKKITTEKAIAGTEDADTHYLLSNQAITSSANEGTDESTLVENDENWTSAKDIAVYTKNLYVLDPKEGLLKFVPAADSYGASTYFTSNEPDLASAVSLAIDSSVYILFENGALNKYTRGAKDEFQITGLGQPLKNPTKVIAQSDFDFIYILDKGNSRIVKIGASGAFAKEYKADIIGKATTFVVTLDEKSLGILADGKAYELTL